MENQMKRSNSMISTAQSMMKIEPSLIVAAPVVIRGRRLRQILHVLPIDVMEVQMLAREFFSRCDLQEKYMSLDKCAETFGISCKIAQGVYSYIRTNDVLDDVPFNYARKLALLYPTTSANGVRTSVIEDLQEWSRIYGETQQQGLHLHTPRKSMLQLPKLYLTFENFVEAAVYLSPRASMQQRFDLAFNIFDANCDGIVDIQDIRNVMLDSLQINLKHNNSSNAGSQNVQNIFQNEVEELLNDLRAQYRSDEFNKDEFIEFAHARGVEFLNCFTVNKHWLRDILGDNKDNIRYARPQDAEMKNFLETICEENKTIDSEEIIDVQETLRDHLVDTVDDLKTINSAKYYHKMNISPRLSTAICKKIKSLKSDQDEEYQELISNGLLDNISTLNSPIANNNNNNNLNLNDIQPIQIKYINYFKIFLPSTVKLLELSFINLYIIQIIILFLFVFNKNEKNITETIGKISSFGLYLCLFIAPLSRYYPFMTKWISLTPNSNLANILLYFTSRESERINIYFAIFYSVMHIISYHSNIYNFTISISGLIMIIFGIVLVIFWRKIKYQDTMKNKNKISTFLGSNHKCNPFNKINVALWTIFRLIFILSFIFHSSNNKSQNFALYIALFPTVLIIILINFEYIFISKKLQVELARNERPNSVLLSICKDNMKWRCGQYILINCASISSVEYHPFYITSSPDCNYIDVSILSCGDWTQKLWEMYVSAANELVPLRVCGPYGIAFSSNKMNYNYDYLLIVTAGNGSVEIIASLLNFVCSNFLSNPKHPIQKIYCYWMVSADDGCYWFYKLLRDLRNMNIDKFFPCIFVTSSNHEKNQNAFGLNFFLALRRESLQTNLITHQIGRLSTGRISTFRKPVSIFTANSRQSRFHNPNPQKIDTKNNPLSHRVDSKHGIEINNDLLPENEEDIPMQSPDFRRVFNKLREELLQHNQNISSHAASPINKSQKIKSQNSMHGIVPALVVATSNCANSQRTFQIGTFFVGVEILEHRLKDLCQQFTDHQVQFEFNSMIVGNQYAKRYST